MLLGVVVAGVLAVSTPALGDEFSACMTRAQQKVSTCPPSTGGQACMAAYTVDMAACRKAADVRQEQRSAAMAEADRQTAQRNARIQEREQLRSELSKFTGGWIEAASDGDLDGAHATVERAALRLKAIALELGESVAPSSDEAARQLLAALDTAVVQEKACRNDKKCMAARAAKKAAAEFFDVVVGPMCQADQMRESAIQDMATERANPSGVVSLGRLHEDGGQIQAANAQLAALAPQYAKFRKHAWPGWRKECSPSAP